jgi:hypothetical protein
VRRNGGGGGLRALGKGGEKFCPLDVDLIRLMD